MFSYVVETTPLFLSLRLSAWQVSTAVLSITAKAKKKEKEKKEKEEKMEVVSGKRFMLWTLHLHQRDRFVYRLYFYEAQVIYKKLF